MKFNRATLKHNRLALITIILSAIILVMLTYAVFFKRIDNSEMAEFHGHKIIFPLLKQKLENLQPELQQFEFSEPEEDDSTSLNKENNEEPMIALVIDGFGLIQPTENSEELPAAVSFGVNASTNLNDPLINIHNTMLNIPLEPEDYSVEFNDSQSLLLNNSSDENIQRLVNILDKVQNNQGVYSSGDEKYTNSLSEVELLLSNLKQRNLIYLCGQRDKNAIVYQLAEKMSFHILANDVILDEIISSEAINKKLLELEKIAKQNGSAIATASSYPLTIELLKNWLPSLEDKGIRIMPINDFYKITQQRKISNAQKQVNIQ